MREKIKFADIEWDERGQPRCRQFDDVYFYQSPQEANQQRDDLAGNGFAENDLAENGLAESRYVFLQQNRLAERWQEISARSDDKDLPTSFVIGETGFGTGLNFLATWQLWQQHQPQNLFLHFVSVERFPLQKPQLQQTLALWPELTEYSRQLLAQYPTLLAPGFYSLHFPKAKITLSLIIDDVENGLRQCLQSDHPNFSIPYGRGFDAWFLDGFAPRRNPRMWSKAVVDTIARLSHQHTSLATFTAVGEVQRLLRAAGFNPEKVPGFAHKREMLRAQFTAPATEPLALESSSRGSPHPLPWAVIPYQAFDQKTVVVIGAGLAGCHSARALAELGWQVTLLESGNRVGGGASGNAQGVVYGKLSADDDALAQFNLSALVFAEQYYQAWWQQDPMLGRACGVLQLCHNVREQQIWRQCREYFSSSSGGDGSAQFVDATQATRIAGVTIDCNAMYFPRLGWLDPGLLCAHLIDHPAITVYTNCRVKQLHQIENLWRALDDRGTIIARGTRAVIANASSALQFSQTQELPLKQIRGQVTYLTAEQSVNQLQTVICGESYITPAIANSRQKHSIAQSLGASFNRHEHDLTVRPEDHQHNLNNIKKILPTVTSAFGALDPANLAGRCGFRCTTPDYLPVVGPVHRHQQFIDEYQLLRVDSNAGIHRAGQHCSGLYINVGHGSRGLAYTPLSAHYLAAQINGDPLPVSRHLAEALHPGRFTIRGLIRRKL